MQILEYEISNFSLARVKRNLSCTDNISLMICQVNNDDTSHYHRSQGIRRKVDGWGFIIGLPIGLAIFGTLLDAVLSRNYRGRSSSGLPTNWFSSFGGFSGSGGSFSGFGGGRSGGGGASRR